MLLLQIFLAFTPFLCLFGLIWLFYGNSHDIFWSAIDASLLWSAAIWLETNLLSWLNLVYGNMLACFWLVCLVILAYLIIRGRPALPVFTIRGWQWAIVAIGLITLVTGLVYPPNNYDVLTYHMPRIEHWLQNNNLAPYATSIDRQVGMAPFNAMIVLQSYGPGRIDYFVNVPQWLAFMGSIAIIANITELLGGKPKARLCAAIFAATLPNAVIQASNTDSCLIVTYFLSLMVLLWLKWRKDHKLTHLALLGICLGLAILSKGSAYPVAFPVVCMICFECLRSPRALLIQGVWAAGLVAIINAPHFCRIIAAEGSPIASAEKNVLRHPTPATFLINMAYNFASSQPLVLTNGGREALQKATSALGISDKDPHIFPWGGLDFAPDYMTPDDSLAPNPFQSACLLVIALAVIFSGFRPPLFYTEMVLAAFCMFFLMLTWHPWISRIQIPLFFLAAPIAGLFMAGLSRAWLANSSLALACFCAIWPLFLCVERPLAPSGLIELYRPGIRHFLDSGRELALFNNIPGQAASYIGAIEYLAERKPERLGLRLGNNGWEYPVWALLRSRMTQMPHIEHVLPGGDKDMPDFTFEFTRNNSDAQTSARVIGRKAQGEEVLYPSFAH